MKISYVSVTGDKRLRVCSFVSIRFTENCIVVVDKGRRMRSGAIADWSGESRLPARERDRPAAGRPAARPADTHAADYPEMLK